MNPHFWSSERRDATIDEFVSPKIDLSNFKNAIYKSPFTIHYQQSLHIPNLKINPSQPPSKPSLKLNEQKKLLSCPQEVIGNKSFLQMEKRGEVLSNTIQKESE